MFCIVYRGQVVTGSDGLTRCFPTYAQASEHAIRLCGRCNRNVRVVRVS